MSSASRAAAWQRCMARLPRFLPDWLVFGVAVGALFALADLAGLSLTREAQIAVSLGLLLPMLWLHRRADLLDRHGQRQHWLRLLAIVLAVFISLRYLAWRIEYTISYHDPLSLLGAVALLAAEIYSLAILLIGAFVIVHPIHRRPAPLPQNPNLWPQVDVLIPTYNEDPALLEVTLLAATQLDYPRERYTVYLCDDGGTAERLQRPDTAVDARVRQERLTALCADLGAIYVTRARNEHAKAGNLNAALRDHCRGELVLILDADHVPTRDILRSTVGFFLRDPRLFLVQTPHHFINPDPLERNLRTYERMPSENEMFYGVIHHGLDFWNASFFCGSAALLRRAHLDEVGGIVGDTLTEDAETALTLHARGYNSVYLDRAMIAGLQPETFGGFLVQRSRWARGMAQIFLLKNPWRQAGLTLAQKLAYTSSVFFWFFPFARMVYFIAPALYLLLSLKIMDAFLPADLIAYALPHIVAVMLLSNLLYGRVRWPLISELYETIQSIHTLPAILRVFRSPRAPTFAVTPKGERLGEDFISQFSLPFYLLMLLNLACIVAGVYRYTVEPEELGVILLTSTLAGINLVFSLGAIGVMLEKAQKRNAYRLRGLLTDLGAQLALPGGARLPVRITDMSYTGVGLRTQAALVLHQDALLQVAVPALGGQPLNIPAQVVRRRYLGDRGWDLGLRFTPNTYEDRRAIVALVFGDSAVHEASRRTVRQRLGILEGLGFLMHVAFRHAFQNFAFLTVQYGRGTLRYLHEKTLSSRGVGA
jgi:cellulose synthase (UDP-forming)